MKENSKVHWIEIYESNFFLVVSDDLDKSRNSKKALSMFSEYRVSKSTQGLACAKDSNHAIYLRRKNLSHSLIAHEVMHAVFHIMENIGLGCYKEEPEPFCYLCGHLSKLVYNDLKRWNIKVK